MEKRREKERLCTLSPKCNRLKKGIRSMLRSIRREMLPVNLSWGNLHTHCLFRRRPCFGMRPLSLLLRTERRQLVCSYNPFPPLFPYKAKAHTHSSLYLKCFRDDDEGGKEA